MLCEQARLEIDDQGGRGCFSHSVRAFSSRSGIADEGLWAAVDAYLGRQDPLKVTARLMKSYGGHPKQWEQWFTLIASEPDCAKAQDMT